ncbi:MAG: hypothetical protein ABIP75_01190 [Pyrinomonadaceae bacterium]
MAFALILAALAALMFPFASGMSASSCAMACCMGMPAHAAGSCGDHGAPANPPEPARDPDDPLCRPTVALGTKAPQTPTETVTIVVEPEGDGCVTGPKQTTPNSGSAENAVPRFSGRILSEPCGQECGACGSSSSQTRTGRETALPVAVGSQKPIVHRVRIAPFSSSQAFRQAVRRRTVPRGPPTAPLA